MFKTISFSVLMLLAAFPALATPPQMDTLAISRSEGGLPLGCAPDTLCVEIASVPSECEGDACATQTSGGGDLSLRLSGGQRDPAHTPYRLTALSPADEDSSLELWPKLIRFEDGILAGVETQVRTSYSGGGASSTTLHLIAFLPGQPPFEVLRAPQRANVMIRACFSERDMKQRAGACHDEYSYYASVALIGTSAGGMPVLRYRSKATSFPGPVSRSKDSQAAGPLRKRDLITVTDPLCSYQRSYRFAPEARGYLPDMPPPDCSDYTVP